MNINEDKYQRPLQIDVVKFRKEHIDDKYAHLFYHELRKWDPSAEGIQARYLPSYQEGLLWQLYDQAIEAYKQVRL